MNKWLKRLIAVLACVMLFTVFAACGEKSPADVTLVDFPAEKNETVYLGDSYKLASTTVSDTEGNTYRVSYEVTRSDGEEVLVIGGEFDIEFLGGYTIVYTAQVGDSAQTSTVKLSVTDNESPLIRISSPSDGTVGKAYTLPQIVVSDLSGNIAEQSVRVYLTEGNVEQNLTEADGTYTFTPQTVGEYKIVVYAKDAAGNEDEAEASFLVKEVFGEDVIFDPTATFAANQITASDPVKLDQGKDGERDYLSVVYEQENNEWVNLSLEPANDLSSYAGYDYISVWMYAVAAEGEVRFSFFNNVDYGVTFQANEWYEAILHMEDFIQFTQSGTMFLPVNYNNAASTNHKSLTEFRLGDITAKNAAEFSVDVKVEEKVSGNAEATLTVTSDAAALPEHSLTVYDKASGEAVLPTKSEGGVYTYSLAAGTYTYELVCTDGGYVADGVKGEFVVENLEMQIELPEITEEYKAGEEFVIPEANILVGGEPSGETASYTAEYTYAATREKIEVETKFTPESSGTLVITYNYGNAVPKTLTVEISRADRPASAAADLRNQDALLDFAFRGGASGTSRLSYVEAQEDEPAYLSWTTTDNAKASWVFFYMKNPLTAAEAEGYDFVKITVKAIGGENSKYRWRALLLNNTVLIGDGNEWYDPERLPVGEWCDIYVPVDDFVAYCGEKYGIISLTLNAPGDGNADNIREVRFAGFELVKSAGVEIKVEEHENVVYTGDALSLPSASLVSADGEPADGQVKVQVYSLIPKMSVKAVENNYQPVSAGEKIVILYTYPTAETVRVELKVLVKGAPAGELLDASRENASLQLSAGNTTVTHGKDGARDYISVVYTGSAWIDINLTPSNDVSSYAEYDYISVWMYAVAAEGEVHFSFFNNEDYKVTFRANEWYEARIPMDVFIAQLEAGEPFLPVNFNNAASTNHKSLTEFRLGDITAKNAAEFSVDVKVEEKVSGNAEATLTVTSDAAALPEHSLTVYDKASGEAVLPTKSEGGVYTYSLAAGTYTYELVCTDGGYVADGVKGEFVVENLEMQIELPEITEEYKAGEEFVIPEANILVGGEPSGETASYTAEYTYAATREKIEVETKFTPESSGTLVITYNYGNAVPKTLTVEISRADRPASAAADLRNQDALLDFAFRGGASGTSRLSYVEAQEDEPAYLSWTTTDNAKASWVFFYMKNPLTAAEAEGYDFVKITVKAIGGENSKYRWRALLLNNTVLIGDGNEWYDPERLPVGEWCDIYVPVDDFVAYCGEKYGIISLTLNAPGDGNADNIREVRFAGFELVKSAGVEIKVEEHENVVYTGDALSLPSASLVSADGEPADGQVKVQVYSLIPKMSVKAVENNYQPVSAGEKIVILYTYPTAETVRVELKVLVKGAPAGELLDASRENASLQLSAGNTTVTHGKDGARDYISVVYTGSAWIDINLTPSNDVSSYAEYDYISVWMYAVAAEGEVHFSFFNNEDYKVTFRANEWYEARIPMDVFIAQLEAGTQFLPVNYNNAGSTNHKSLTGIRFGDITAVKESGSEA